MEIKCTGSGVPYWQVEQGLVDPMKVIPIPPAGAGWQFEYTAMWGKPYTRVGGPKGRWFLGSVWRRPIG